MGRVALFALALVWAAGSRAEQVSETWFRVRNDAGITSWQSERADRALAAFRARTVLATDLWTALAILDDVDRACEWTSRCAEMTRLSDTADEEGLLVYARIDAPWPVRDRDVVVTVRPRYEGPGRLVVSIASTSSVRPQAVSGVVRMPSFRAHYRFEALSEASTSVEYEIDVDPGGVLPDWLKRMIARDLAYDTLSDLRKRVQWAEARGAYSERKLRLSSRARTRGFRDAL